MPRGPRQGRPVSIDSGDPVERHARSERRLERKISKVMAATHGGYAGPSIIEILESKLLGACVRYLAVKAGPSDAGLTIDTARGIVRGMAEGVATMRNPYVADRRAVIKSIEKEFMHKARLVEREFMKKARLAQAE